MATKTPVHTQLTPAFSLFSKSKDLVTNNLRLFIPLYIIPLLFQVAPSLGRGRRIDNGDISGYFNDLSGGGVAIMVLIGLVLVVAVIVITLIVQTMLYALELKVSAGKKTTLDQLFEVAKKYWLRILGYGILYGLMVIGGLILLIVPGLIVIRRYFLAPYYMIDKDLSISEAMKQSAAESKAYSSSIWGVIGVSVLIAMLAIIPVLGVIASFILGMLYSVAPALRYREIRALSGGK